MNPNVTIDNLDQLKEVIEKHRNTSGCLMQILQEAQNIYGYLPIEVQQMISEELDIPLSEIYGVATFYSQFTLNPKGKYTIGVCLGTACYIKGSQQIMDELTEELGITVGQTTEDGKYTIEATRCVGACGLAPVLMVNEDVYGRLSSKDVKKILAKY
ncbi:MAG: NADH-quinone oxidoreductase subunit NuoE [Eubacteriales bacterium]